MTEVRRPSPRRAELAVPTTTRATPHKPRVPRGARSAIGLLIALGLVALAALAATAAIQVRLDRRHTALGDTDVVARWLRGHAWTDGPVLAIAVALVVIGGLLVLAAVLPARRRLIELNEPHPGTTTGITRAGLRRELSAVAGDVDGIDSARARVRWRTVRIRAVSTLRDRTGLRDAVQAAVTDELALLDPRRTRHVRTTLQGKDPS